MTALALLDLDHLRPEARAHALENDEARIRRIRADRFVPYARAIEGLKLLEDLLAYPERTCMPNVLIHADAGMGKTMLAAKFRRDHPASFDAEQGATITPVIFVEMLRDNQGENRIASPELWPAGRLLPHLICSLPVWNGRGGHGADQHGDA